MKLNRTRKYRHRLQKTSGVFKNNPVLAFGLALPFVIVPSLSLKSGVAMSLILLAATVPTAVASSLADRKIPIWMRAPCCVLLSMGCILAIIGGMHKNPLVLDSLGVYVPLAAGNTLMLELAVFHPRDNAKAAFFDASKMCLGLALVLCGVSALREILGNRTIWDVEFGLYPIRMSGVMLPFFGFILLGFLGALFRCVDRAILRTTLRHDAHQPGE
ncbi:MAG: Rnf-Nqr domain containing protein, partial [Oscillospiraceae bacterium]